jgi:uncharacterized protein
MRLRPRLLAVALVALVAGCSSPNPNLYTLAAAPGPAIGHGPKVVMLRDLSLAHYLDRPQIVRSSENYRLDVMSNDWWGEALGPMLTRVLVEELNQRLPGSLVYAENGAVSTRPDAVVELNIERMDADGAGNVVLSAQASVKFTGRPAPVGRAVRLTVTPTGKDIGAEVAAMSAAVGQLADTLAATLRTP